jgi:hypothetical protein
MARTWDLTAPLNQVQETDIPGIRGFDLIDEPGSLDHLLTIHFQNGTSSTASVSSAVLFALGVLLAGGRNLN